MGKALAAQRAKYMAYLETVKKLSGPLFDIGFTVVHEEDDGMGKISTLRSKDLEISFVYEKGPISCEVIYGNKWLKLIHLLNFLYKNECKTNIKSYSFPRYFWENENENTDELYIQYFVKILKENMNRIIKFVKEADETQLTEFKEYYQNENDKNWNMG